MVQRKCEVCSQRVTIHNDGYGTHFYLPAERGAIIREVVELLMQLSTDPEIQILTATDALTHASKLVMVDRPASPIECEP